MDCSVEEDQEDLIFSYDISHVFPWTGIRREKRELMISALIDVGKLQKTAKLYRFTLMVNSIDEILNDESKIQKWYDLLYFNLKNEYNRIVAKQRTMVTLCAPLVAYSGYPQVEDFDHTIQLGDVNNPYDPVYTDATQGNQQANCYRVDMTERNGMEHRDWYSYMERDLGQMESYYSGTNILGCERSEDGLTVTLEDQTFFFHLENGGWWMDENGRYLITVGPNVLNMKYNDGSLNFTDFSKYFGCRIDIVLVNDRNPDDILTLECVYAGDIKKHTSPNGVYMTGRTFPDNRQTDDPDGSIVEFIGSPNRVDENGPKSAIDNGFMKDYHVELIIVYDNAAEVN